MAGKLIIIEGMDGAGTTTQTKGLSALLSNLGAKVIISREPTASAIGQETRRLLAQKIEKEPDLLASLALCFAADRMQHVHETIRPHLKTHDFVILDRYVLSSLVYQGLHLPTTFVKEINRYAVKPDLTVVLDVDVETACDRLARRVTSRDFYESPALLEKIRSRYLHFAKEDPSTTVLIDGTGDVSQVQSHIMHIMQEKYSVYEKK